MHKYTSVCLLLISPVLLAQDALVTLHSTVTGAREQPKVMYIVPWQQPGDPEFEHGMRGSIAAELFVPLDRDEFVRGLEYQALLNAQSEAEASAGSADTAGELANNHQGNIFFRK